MLFRGSIAPPIRPLSTLRCALAGRQRMTQGQRDWLDLRCRALSSPAPCRFIPTLSPINHHVAGPGANPGSRTEVRLGARAHTHPHPQPRARTTRTNQHSTQPPRTTRLTRVPCTSKEPSSAAAPADACLWAISQATHYSPRSRSGRPLFREALVREGSCGTWSRRAAVRRMFPRESARRPMSANSG